MAFKATYPNQIESFEIYFLTKKGYKYTYKFYIKTYNVLNVLQFQNQFSLLFSRFYGFVLIYAKFEVPKYCVQEIVTHFI